MAKRPIDRCPTCGSKTVNISWSALKVWEECRQKSSLMKGGKKRASMDARNFFPGRITDKVVRDWLNGDLEPKRMIDMVEPMIENELSKLKGEVVLWRDAGDRKFVTAQCIEAVKRIEPALEKYVLPYKWQVDFGFKAPLLMGAPDGGMDRVVLTGYMDIIVWDPETDTWRIYDVKHTENKDYWRGSFGQLAFYALANQVMFGKPPIEVGFFQPLVGEQVKRFAITQAEINMLATRVQGMADGIWREDHTPRIDNTVCFHCEVKHACSKFKAVEDGKGHARALLFD